MDANVTSVNKKTEGRTDDISPDFEYRYSKEMNSILKDIGFDPALLYFINILREDGILFSENLPNYQILKDLGVQYEGEITYTFSDEGRIEEIKDIYGDRTVFYY